MRIIKFRAWHNRAKEMLYGETRHVFSWEDEGQDLVIEQFTGRIDLKGVEIYDGDRVSDPHGYKGECELFTVRYSDELCGFELVGEGEAEWDETDWQVYDNIHERKPTIRLSEQ